MKKFLVAFLSIVLLFTSIPFAASAEQSGNDDLVNKAAIVFPEFAEKLLTPGSHPSTRSNYASARVLVTSITRPASDKEYITYNEYSDGLIMLSRTHFTSDSSTVNSSIGANYKDYTVNITAACKSDYYTGYFYIDGVSYTIFNGANVFDVITNSGTPRKGTNCTNYERGSGTLNETYFSYAQISYNLRFKVGPSAGQEVNSLLTFSVGEDAAILSHVDQT